MANKLISAGDETMSRLLAGPGIDDDESASALVAGLFAPITASAVRGAAASATGRTPSGGANNGGGFGGVGGEGEVD